MEGLTPMELEQTARAVREIARDVAAIREKAGAAVKEVEEGTKRVAEQVSRTKTETEKLTEMSNRFWAESRQGINAFNAIGRSLSQVASELQRGQRSLLHWKTAFRDIQSTDELLLRNAARRRGEYDKMVDSLKAGVQYLKMGSSGSPYAQVGLTATGITGERGLVAAGQRGLGAIRQLTADMPLGGLLGFLMWGGVKQQEWDAGATRVARIMTSTGSVGTQLASKLRGMFESLRVEWGLNIEDLAGITTAFSEAGIEANALTQTFAGVPEGMQKSIAGMSLALDTLTGAPVGSWAKNIAQAMSVSGESVAATTSKVKNLALEFRGTGVNINALMGSFLQMQGAMRFQRQGLEDVSAAFSTFHSAIREQGGLFAGANKQASAQFALAGVQSLSGAVAGLGGNMGLAAELARRTGMGDDGVSAYIALQEGRLGGPAAQGHQFGLLVGQMGKLAREVAPGNEANQKFFAMKQYGLDIAGANALLKISKQLEGKSAEEQQKILAANQKDLNTVFKDKSRETADWQKRIEGLQMGMVLISQAMLGGITLLTQIGLGDLFGISQFWDKGRLAEVKGALWEDATKGFEHVATAVGRTFSPFSMQRYSLDFEGPFKVNEDTRAVAIQQAILAAGKDQRTKLTGREQDLFKRELAKLAPEGDLESLRAEVKKGTKQGGRYHIRLGRNHVVTIDADLKINEVVRPLNERDTVPGGSGL